MPPRPAPRTITQLQQGMNACLLYEDGDDPVRLVLPYILSGLHARERCVYVLGDHDPARVKRALADAGVDVPRELDHGSLILIGEWEVSFPDGRFNPTAMVQYVREAIAGATGSGFRGLRVIAEMSWALQMGVGHNQLIHYEALGANLYPDEAVTAVCMYNRSRFGAEVCHDALRCHPLVVQGDQVYANLYYEVPERFAGGPGLAEQLDWMLEQLRVLREAEEERLAHEREQAARAEAEARVRARDEFISIAAHELRTPLTSVLGYARMAESRLEQLCEADRGVMGDLISTVGAEAQRLGDLLERLLNVNQIASGRLEIEREPLDLREVTRRAIRRAQVGMTQHIRFSPPATPIRVLGDPLRMEQVMANLLDNARKYGPPDGEIEVMLAAVDGEARLAVRDHGDGISDDDRARIFDRYVQAGVGRGGMGLGLHIAREIVGLHGGRIWLETPDGGGSRFVISLPTLRDRRAGRPEGITVPEGSLPA